MKINPRNNPNYNFSNTLYSEKSIGNYLQGNFNHYTTENQQMQSISSISLNHN